jgi:hypothetical protein
MKVSLDFNNVKDADLVLFCRGVYKGMKGNRKFPKSPVDLEVFKGVVDRYDAAITKAMDGGKKAISERNKLREEVIKLLPQLGHYVAAIAEDSETVYSAGFEPAYKLRRLPQSLPTTSIRKIDHGPISGTLDVWITPISRSFGKVSYYELRRTETNDGALIGEWTLQQSMTARFPIRIKNLKPGTVYAFQARAVGKSGLTDWSDSATFMCS